VARSDVDPVVTAASSSTAAAYPPGATGSAPVVATTSAGRSGTVASTPALDRAPEVRTVTPVNARPSSSAVRSEPTTTERNAPCPQASHRQRVASRPHHPHCAVASPEVSCNGP
jgi:hypothetical protein